MDFTPRGYAIGAAVGAAAGNPNAPVVCITGDGDMLLNGQEICVAKIERLPVIYVVLNETVSGYFDGAGNVLEEASHHRRSPASDFAAFARALGADAHLIKTLADLQAIDFDVICRRKGPTLLDVRLVVPGSPLGTQESVTAERR